MKYSLIMKEGHIDMTTFANVKPIQARLILQELKILFTNPFSYRDREKQ